MGYDIHIHRKQDWLDEAPAIPEAEWTSLFRADASLWIGGGSMETDDDGQSRETPIVGFGSLDQPDAAFYFHAGMIETKNPTTRGLVKAWEIARSLDARVQGDNGEFYGADGAADARQD